VCLACVNMLWVAQVLSVPFYKWQALATPEARVAHLRELLLPAPAAPPLRAAPVSARSSSATVSRGDASLPCQHPCRIHFLSTTAIS
jgi:hypothetical protein